MRRSTIFRKFAVSPSWTPHAFAWSLTGAVLVAGVLGGGNPIPAQNSGAQRNALPGQPFPQSPSAASDGEGRGQGENGPGAALPPGFDPPGKLPDVFTMEKEFLTEAEETRLKRESTSFTRALKSKSLSEKDRETIADCARYYVYRLSMKSHRSEIHDIRAQLMRQLQLHARTGPGREELLKQVVAHAADLLEGTNYHVRLNAVIVLSQLNLDDGDPRREIPPTAYAPAAEPLMDVVMSDEQHVTLKINAVNGLTHIATHSQMRNLEKLKLSKAFVAELQQPNLHYWYQWRLVEALGKVGIANDLQGNPQRPFVVQALGEILVDKKRDWLVRSEAARSIGRLPLGPNIHISMLAVEMLNLGRQMAEAYSKNPANFNRKSCFFRLFLAFDDRTGPLRAGLVEKFGGTPEVRKAYEELTYMVKHVYNSGRPIAFSAESLQKWDEWLKENKPQNYRVAPNEEPLLTAGGDAGSAPAEQDVSSAALVDSM